MDGIQGQSSRANLRGVRRSTGYSVKPRVKWWVRAWWTCGQWWERWRYGVALLGGILMGVVGYGLLRG